MARSHSNSGTATLAPARRRGGNGHMSRRQVREMISDSFGFEEVQSIFSKDTFDTFRDRWLINCDDRKRVMEHMRDLTGDKPNTFVAWLIRTQISFYNCGFEITSNTKLKETAGWLEKHPSYDFARLSRDIWREYATCSNVVAFWREARTGDNSSVDGLPRVTIFDSERVRYENEFGVERLWIKPEKRKLKQGERRLLGKRYADAIEQGKELLVSESEGEYFKVLSTAKLGDGLGMPKWRSIFDDLAILDLLKIGDWNGAWARKKLMRHTKKGHKVEHGPLAGTPDFYFQKPFGDKLKKFLNGIQGYSEFVSNFDQEMDYLYLEAAFFDPKVYEAVEMRLDRFAGAIGMMMREGPNPSPYLMPIFRTEGLQEREVVGNFIESILNDKNFYGSGAPPARLVSGWDETIFFNEKMLTMWLSMAYQNGFSSPQTMRRWMRLNDLRENELMVLARENEENYQPIFEPKQGLLQDPAAGGAGGGEGRPKRSDGNQG